VDSHFEFGANWASYALMIDDERIEEAERSLKRLLGSREILACAFLDIGCGSGLHSLAAGRLGARRVVAMDVDPNSVETARALLDAHPETFAYEVMIRSVLDISAECDGQFDIVYSWGALHHTGAMNEAIRRAAACVKDGGLFAIALYRKTPFCNMWRIEKRWYKQAPRVMQRAARGIYAASMWAAFTATGRNFRGYVNAYKGSRGMDYWHDIHDWLGGYPYESISPGEVEKVMRELGFEHVRSFIRAERSALIPGCDEYVYRRKD
jgi:2-polyprenyl-6-hydroxyphenyl methylase/3-demethylubiquinone-9 3-methyltransferase